MNYHLPESDSVLLLNQGGEFSLYVDSPSPAEYSSLTKEEMYASSGSA